MKLFGQRAELTPVEQAQAALEQCAAKRDRLVLQLRDAERNHGECKSAAAAAALAENADLAADLADDVANIVARHEALEHAVGLASAEVFTAEQVLAAAQDAADRAASVAELTALVAEIQSGALPFKAALGNLVGLLNRGGEISHDARAVAGLFCQLELDAGQLLNTACEALEHHANQIEGGAARATLPRPQPAPAPIAVPSTTSAFPLFDIRWTDHAGTIRYAARGWEAPLPIATAQRALVAGILVPADSPQAVQGRKERGSVHADLERAVDLDQANPTPPPPPAERLINPSKAVWCLPGDTPPAWFKAPT
jgi:hypothetical protein